MTLQISGLMDRHIEILIAWARRTPAVVELYVFGSRAKGTWRPGSDLDVAVKVAFSKEDYREREVDWVFDLEEELDIGRVHLVRLDGPNTPKTTAAVGEAGILIYRT